MSDLTETNNDVCMTSNNTHANCWHKGQKKTHKKVSEHYANIPISLVKMFIEQCERRTKKLMKNSQSGIVILLVAIIFIDVLVHKQSLLYSLIDDYILRIR